MVSSCDLLYSDLGVSPGVTLRPFLRCPCGFSLWSSIIARALRDGPFVCLHSASTRAVCKSDLQRLPLTLGQHCSTELRHCLQRVASRALSLEHPRSSPTPSY